MQTAGAFADEPVELSARFAIDPAVTEGDVARLLKKESSVRKGQLLLLVFGFVLGVAVAAIGGSRSFFVGGMLFAIIAWIAW